MDLHSFVHIFPEVAMSVGTVDIKMVVKLVIFGSDAGFWDFPAATTVHLSASGPGK